MYVKYCTLQSYTLLSCKSLQWVMMCSALRQVINFRANDFVAVILICRNRDQITTVALALLYSVQSVSRSSSAEHELGLQH